MRRREFIGLFGGGAFYWPCAARAQRAGVPVVGYLLGSAPDAPWFTGFRDSLKNAGFVEGQNIILEGHWVEGHYDKLPTMASELVQHPVAVIVAPSLPALFTASEPQNPLRVRALQQFEEQGLIDGRDIRINCRWAGSDVSRMESLARELVEM